jgi:hypothetical protein
MAAQKSDAVVIKDYFGMTLPEARAELTGPDAMSAEAKKEIADGIRDGSLTYGKPSSEREAAA